MQLALNFENSNLSGNSMELDNLNSFSGSRRNNFSRSPNNFQRNTRPNFKKSYNFRNSNFRNNPRPFLNFSRNPPQNNFRYRQRKPQSNFGQSNSFSSFRRPGFQQSNRRQPSYPAHQSGGPRPLQSQNFRWRPRQSNQHPQMNCMNSYNSERYEVNQSDSAPQLNYQGAQAAGPCL